MTFAPPHAATADALDLAQLERQWATAPIPVLAYTRDRILHAAENDDDVDLNRLAAVISSDPLMTLRVLRQASAPTRGLMHNPPKTTLEALLLIGTGPLFRASRDMPVVQDVLADKPEALAGLTAAMTRSYHAARMAHRFASMLDDPDAEVIHEAALLHDFAELLLWLHRPRLAVQSFHENGIAGLGVGRHPTHHDLPVDLVHLGASLMKSWRLNPQLIRMIEANAATSTRCRLVDLAVRLADSHLASGDAPDPAVLREAARLLNLSPDATRQVLRQC